MSLRGKKQLEKEKKTRVNQVYVLNLWSRLWVHDNLIKNKLKNKLWSSIPNKSNVEGW